MKFIYSFSAIILFSLQIAKSQSFHTAYKPALRDYDVTSLTYAFEIDEKLYTIHNYQNDTNLNKHLIMTHFRSDGTVEWAKEYSGEQMLAWSVIKTSDNHLLLTGRPSNALSPLSVRMIKIDTLGGIVWSKSYTVPSNYSNTAAVSLSEASDGYVLFFNASTFNSFAGTFNSDPVIIKVTKSSGEIISQLVLDGGLASAPAIHAQVLENNNYLISGRLSNIQNSGVGFIMQLSTDGSIVWKKKFVDNTIYNIVFGKSVEHNGSIYQAGTITYQSDNLQLSKGYLMKISTGGNIEFVKQYSNDPDTGGVRFKNIELTDAGFRIFGTSILNEPNSFVLELDEEGSVISSRGYQWGVSRLSIYNSVGLGLSAGNEISGLTSNNGGFIFQHISVSSCISDDFNFSMMRTDASAELECDSLNLELNFSSTETSIDSEDFTINTISPTVGVSEFTNIASMPFEWEVYDLCGCLPVTTISSANSEIHSNQAIHVFPNPNTGNLKVNGLISGDQITIYDFTGKVISNQRAENEFEFIHLNTENGIYLLNITRNNSIVLSRKIHVLR